MRRRGRDVVDYKRKEVFHLCWLVLYAESRAEWDGEERVSVVIDSKIEIANDGEKKRRY